MQQSCQFPHCYNLNRRNQSSSKNVSNSSVERCFSMNPTVDQQSKCRRRNLLSTTQLFQDLVMFQMLSQVLRSFHHVSRLNKCGNATFLRLLKRNPWNSTWTPQIVKLPKYFSTVWMNPIDYESRNTCAYEPRRTLPQQPLRVPEVEPEIGGTHRIYAYFVFRSRHG